MRHFLCLATVCLALPAIPCHGEEAKVTSVSTEPYSLKFTDAALELKGPNSYQREDFSVPEISHITTEADKMEGVQLTFDARNSVVFKNGVSTRLDPVLTLHSSDGQKIEIPRNSEVKLWKITINLEVDAKPSKVIVWRPRE